MNPDVEMLLDLEAGVDEEEEEITDDELENELMMQFLDDESIGPEDDPPKLGGQEIEEENDASNVDWDAYLDRARQRGARSENSEVASHEIERLLPYVTKPNDYPLWRIPCRVGIEYNALVSLFNTVHPRHQVRSIVLRDSIPGFVYIEATMNADLIKLLKITPGIIVPKTGLKRTGISSNDFADLFRMNDTSARFRRGVWVNIHEGLYQDDVGLVIGTKDWCIEVLVVPRLTNTPCNSQKRKRSTVRPSPNLFDPSAFSETKYVKTGDNTYQMGSIRIENGLVRRFYDFAALDVNVNDISYVLFKKFLWSRHPVVLDTDMPRPREWLFDIDDKVVILSSGRQSQITAMYPTYLEVNRNVNSLPHRYFFIEEDYERVRWHNIQKLIEIGNYVRVTGGPHLGQCGWVVSTEGEEADISAMQGNRAATIKELTVAINCLQLAAVPQDIAQSGIVVNETRERRHNWIGRNVIVTKMGHPSKGKTGTVKDIVRSHPESASIKILVEFGGILRPGLPFEKILIPEDYVELDMRFVPIEDTNEDPPASTHVIQDSAMEDVNTSSEPEHVLLRPCFEHLEVKANVKGGPFESQKEKFIQVVKVNDRMLLRTQNQRTVVTLEPAWVSIMHPKAKGDNNLLIFICGDHIGKFCRRIHHRDDISGPVSIYVAIVERHPDTGDSLSGEQVEAPMHHFGIVLETKAEKDNKNRLMDKLRKKWQGKD